MYSKSLNFYIAFYVSTENVLEFQLEHTMNFFAGRKEWEGYEPQHKEENAIIYVQYCYFLS